MFVGLILGTPVVPLIVGNNHLGQGMCGRSFVGPMRAQEFGRRNWGLFHRATELLYILSCVIQYGHLLDWQGLQKDEQNSVLISVVGSFRRVGAKGCRHGRCEARGTKAPFRNRCLGFRGPSMLDLDLYATGSFRMKE